MHISSHAIHTTLINTQAFDTDSWWQNQCLSDQTLREEFFIKTHWSMLLMGMRFSPLTYAPIYTVVLGVALCL